MSDYEDIDIDSISEEELKYPDSMAANSEVPALKRVSSSPLSIKKKSETPTTWSLPSKTKEVAF